MTTTTISSQRYIDPAIAGAKRDTADYAVSVYPVEVDGAEYMVVVDGHHSLAAAREAGVSPEYRQVTGPIRGEYDAQLAKLGPVGWLEAHWIDSPYYDVDTGSDVW